MQPVRISASAFLVLLLGTTFAIAAQQSFQDSEYQNRESVVLALLVHQAQHEKLRLDLYQVHPDSLLSKVSQVLSFDTTKMQQQYAQKIVDQIFQEYQISDYRVRKKMLDQAGFVLRDNALQEWIKKYGVSLAQKIGKTGRRLVSWGDIVGIASQQAIMLPALHTHAHEMAIKSYIIGFMQLELQNFAYFSQG